MKAIKAILLILILAYAAAALLPVADKAINQPKAPQEASGKPISEMTDAEINAAWRSLSTSFKRGFLEGASGEK